jgi:hypothetical protein
MQITNHYKVNLLTAVWLLNDDYDFDHSPKTISMSALIKPLKKQILGKRVEPTSKTIDVADLMSSALGSSIHDAIEAVWLNKEKREAGLRKLGIPQDVIASILVNPNDEELFEGCIPVYLEQRVSRMIGGYKITGKYDAIADGQVNDTKSTGVFSYMKGTKDEDYIRQLSGYKWLNPTKVTDPIGKINFVFTDWQAFRANQDPAYPEKRMISKEFTLMSDAQVEEFILKRIHELEKYMDSPEADIPECTQEDLWMDPPVYKYYSDPSKITSGGRATKNFKDPEEAQRFLFEKGKGQVVTVEGTPKACGYCDAYEICEQRKRYDQL